MLHKVIDIALVLLVGMAYDAIWGKGDNGCPLS